MRRRPRLPLAFIAFLSILVHSTAVPAEVAQSSSPSEWQESEKEAYRGLLQGFTCDVLVVPFQVQGYGIDRPGRSLMTRYLSDRIAKTTDARVPSATLVSRALGAGARTVADEDAYSLANALGVRLLVRGYVGHDRNESLTVAILVQERRGKEPLSAETPSARTEWSGIPFSDENPPEEAFRTLLDPILSKLPLARVRVPEGRTARREDAVRLPDLPEKFAEGQDLTPTDRAFRLQVLGTLFPGDSEAREGLFERSLVALSEAAASARGYRLLRSRALFQLHRRPAAVAALGDPATPDEKTFSAYLDADLPEMEKHVAAIRSPLPRLVAEIETNDVRQVFDSNLVRAKELDRITGEHPGWEAIVANRLRDRDPWGVESNLPVKKLLDRISPIPGFTAQGLATGRAMLGESPLEGDDVELSVVRHRRRILATRAREFAAERDASAPVGRDILDLLSEIAESNLLKKAVHSIQTQKLPEVGLKTLDVYDAFYRGHPMMSAWRAIATLRLSTSATRESKSRLRKEAAELAARAFAWSGGQTRSALGCYRLLAGDGQDMDRFSAYDGDYPKRSYWPFGDGDRDALQKNRLCARNARRLAAAARPELRTLELSVLYDHTDFKLFHRYRDAVAKGGKQAAEELLKSNGRRYFGHRDRAPFLANLRINEGDEAGAIRILEEAIAANPETFDSYESYGAILIRNGKTKEARDIFLKYPPFALDRGFNTVGLSNRAFDAAMALYWRGAVDEATPLLEIAARYENGSRAQLKAAARLALLEGDYKGAMARFLASVKRYGDPASLASYLSLLHVTGYGKQAGDLFDSIIGRIDKDAVWEAASVGLRLEAKTDDEILEWYSREPVAKAGGDRAGLRMLPAFLVDRKPDRKTGERIRAVEAKSGAKLHRGSRYADAWQLMAGERFSEAADAFVAVLKSAEDDRTVKLSVTPFLAWSAVRSGRIRENALRRIVEGGTYNDNFSRNLSHALIHGHFRQVNDAVEHLRAASARIPVESRRVIPPWYMLVQACEWVADFTRDPRCRELALEWARKHQRIDPTAAWAYAVEAKYTENEIARQRALGVALFLDARSQRASKALKVDVRKGREWMAKNNPFRNDLKFKGV